MAGGFINLEGCGIQKPLSDCWPAASLAWTLLISRSNWWNVSKSINLSNGRVRVMSKLDEIDTRLIAALRRDGRASISDLAAKLKLARATVRNRIERLVSSGEIAGFSVQTRADVTTAPVRGLTLVCIEGRGTDRITAQLQGLPAVQAIHSTNGRWDLIIDLATDTLQQLDDTLVRIRNIDGITASETNLILSTRRPSTRR
ncbi:AsnC family transcriptional regulator [Hoeflea halophila]|uniref:AsnC family transcriptional regulator n=2 Tax=Hoeflea halophila TaxID=714899 RepID=A0A286IGK1_9HYPH|nr:AsnC family transcriptional regulator [Hoeflea halophila]